jgi:hypothetical protein
LTFVIRLEIRAQISGKDTFLKNLFEKFSRKNPGAGSITACFPNAPKQGQPDQALDQEKQKTGYSTPAYPRVPILFFHVQSVILRVQRYSLVYQQVSL